MRRFLPIMLTCCLLWSCDEVRLTEPTSEINDETLMEAEYMTQAVAGLNASIQSTLIALFDYPQIHGLEFAPVPEQVQVRSSSCPNISPDPNEEITNFPATYTIDFGSSKNEPISSSCELGPSHRTSGLVEVILDGQFCAQEGAKIKIRPYGGDDDDKDFYVNGLRCFIKNDDGCINLEFAGRDDEGNMCFAADLSDICIYNPRNNLLVSMYQWDDAIMKLCDVEENDNFNNPATLLDNQLKVTYTQFYCGVDKEVTRIINAADPTNPWDNPLLFGLLCQCPMGGMMNMGSTTVSWDSCDGQTMVNNTPMNMGACTD